MSAHTQIGGDNHPLVGSIAGVRDNDILIIDCMFTVSAGNATTTTLIADSKVPAGWKIFIDGYSFTQTGTTWSGGTNFILQDSAGVAFVTVTVANSGMPTSTTWVDRVIPATRTPITEALAMGQGGTASKGLQLKITGNMSAGSAMTIRLRGTCRPVTPETFS